MTLETIVHISWALALIMLVHKRKEIAATLRAIPMRYRILVGALLIGCAFIPGPVDDFIIAGLVARMARR